MKIDVTKRSGQKEPLNLEKWQAQITKICTGIADVSQSMVEIKAPVAALIIIGIKAVILISAKTTSIANKTPAIGALKAAPIPAATPHESNKILSF